MTTLAHSIPNIFANNFQRSLKIHPVPRCDVVVSLRHLVSRSTIFIPIMHPSHHLKFSELFVAVGNCRFVIVVSREKNGGLSELGLLELLKLKMQEDSPGGSRKRMRNERYNTPTKPKKLSVSAAKQKAKEFATKDDKSTRVLAKQAILKELSTHLVVRAQGVAPQSRRKGDKNGNDSGMWCKMQNNCCCLMFAGRLAALVLGGKFEKSTQSASQRVK